MMGPVRRSARLAVAAALCAVLAAASGAEEPPAAEETEGNQNWSCVCRMKAAVYPAHWDSGITEDAVVTRDGEPEGVDIHWGVFSRMTRDYCGYVCMTELCQGHKERLDEKTQAWLDAWEDRVEDAASSGTFEESDEAAADLWLAGLEREHPLTGEPVVDAESGEPVKGVIVMRHERGSVNFGTVGELSPRTDFECLNVTEREQVLMWLDRHLRADERTIVYWSDTETFEPHVK